MDKKKKFIWQLAKRLSSQNMQMTVRDLARNLNNNNFLTSYGSQYKGGRGTYKLISATYYWLHQTSPKNAEMLAHVFTNQDGKLHLLYNNANLQAHLALFSKAYSFLWHQIIMQNFQQPGR